MDVPPVPTPDANGEPARRFVRIRFSSLRARIILLLLLIVLPALAIIAYNGLEQQRHAAREARHRILHVAREIGAEYDRLLVEGRRLLTTLAHTPAVTRAGNRACARRLRGYLANNPAFANLGVIDRQGRIQCSAVEMPSRVDVADRAYFQRALALKDFAVGNFQIGRITGIPVLVLAQPVFDRDRRIDSVLFAALKLDWLNTLANENDLAAGTTLTLFDQSRTILVRRPDAGRWVGRQGEAGAPGALLRGRDEGTAEALGLDGVRRLFAFLRLGKGTGGGDLYLSVGMPTHRAYAEIRSITLRNLALLGAAALFVLIAAWIGTDRFVLRRLRALGSAAQRLAQGDLTARTELPSGDDELSRLAARFDEMAARLGFFIERTSRLTRIYAVLSGINSALLRLRERDELLEEVCRVAVEKGGFQLAWIGLRDPADTQVRPLAAAGPAIGYLRGLSIDLSPALAEGAGPTATALRTGRPYVCNDIHADPHMAPWRQRAQAHGLRASVALPIHRKDQVIGALNLYADKPAYFDDEEMRLLEEIAADIALGLEHIDQEKEIRFLANYDTLTKLPNRSLLLDRLAQAIKSARHARRSAAMLGVYVDNVREVSTAVGHHAADDLIVEVARCLAAAVRDGDTVARLSGSAFGVVLADLARVEDAVPVAHRLLEDLPEHIDVGEERIYLSTRAGIALYPTDAADAETLLKNAEFAMWERRVQHQNSLTFYSPALNTRVAEWHALERDLHLALEERQLTLHYQPVVDLDARQWVGVEALARWPHPRKGDIPPGKFIPVAEASGLIVPLGEWVLETAVRQGMAWARTYGRAPRMGINVSAKQLYGADLDRRIREILEAEAHDVQRAPLALEITESELHQDIDRVIAMLAKLRGQGLLIYIDDFGTGYSSLSYLHRLPVDVLKIDRSFIRHMVSDPHAATMVEGIISLARGLRLEVIAEGVETQAQLERLGAFGCQAAQGFLFGRPAAAEALERQLAEQMQADRGR